jgi:hypothetical protein
MMRQSLFGVSLTELEIPPEPVEIKESIKTLIKAAGGKEVYAIWFGNRLAAYLWKTWKKVLATEGMTWQDFMKTMKNVEKEAVRWVKEEASWKDLIETIVNNIKGRGYTTDKKGGLLRWIKV